jgi:two-component system, NarL family, response regulator DegU
MEAINICLVDDHTLFRKAMMRLLATFGRIGDITDAENGQVCLDLLKKAPVLPDVVLLDLDMPVMNGVDTAEAIRQKYPDLKIIILTMHDNQRYMMHMIELGVHSFLLKDCSADELERAIHAVVDKEYYHNDLMVAALRRSVKVKSERPSFNKLVELTDREREIFMLICAEMSLKDISTKLSVSERTIHAHKSNIQQKLNLKNTVSMIKFAYENGFLS